MKNLHVWVDYSPRLYQDLILRALQLVDQKEVGINLTLHYGRVEEHPGELPAMDIILNSTECNMDRINSPHQPEFSPQAAWIVFSPKGTQGWRRFNNDSRWELIRPFGINDLLEELLEMAKRTQHSVLS